MHIFVMMQGYKSLMGVLLAGFLAFGCGTDPEPAEPVTHEFTEMELHKMKVDDAFTVFFRFMNPESLSADPWREIVNHSHVENLQDGTLRYTYVRGDMTLVQMDVYQDAFTARLYGGILIEGNYPSEEDPVVYINDERVATLGFIWYEYRDSGETVRQLTPVFRFDDGTSYAVTGVVLVDPLIEYLIKNVFTTE